MSRNNEKKYLILDEDDDDGYLNLYEEYAKKPSIMVELGRWREGIDLEKQEPKPFDIDLWDYPSFDNFNSLTDQEKAEVAKREYDVLLHNTALIDELNEHIIQISELDPGELEELYSRSDTSDSDKSIIACIEFLRLVENEHTDLFSSDQQLCSNFRRATSSIYAFNVIKARRDLAEAGSHFRILTRKEQAEAAGTAEDIASAALESFLMNPSYDNARILDYDDYLYGIMLDCIKRKVVNQGGTKVIKEELNLEEFQERIIESMSGAVLDNDRWQYSSSELDALQEPFAKMYADYTSGHHFPTDAEKRGTYVSEGGSGNIYRHLTDGEKRNDFGIFSEKESKATTGKCLDITER